MKSVEAQHGKVSLVYRDTFYFVFENIVDALNIFMYSSKLGVMDFLEKGLHV